MSVVRNLMLRIGADFTGAKRTLDSAEKRIQKFKKSTQDATRQIRGDRGLNGLNKEFKNLASTVRSSLSEIQGARGFDGVARSISALIPVVGSAAKAFRGFGAQTASAGASAGMAGLAVGALAAAVGAAVAGIAKASQPAAKFEAAIMRLNMQLGANTRSFMEWADAQGLAKQTAAEMGSTYAVLLSSFIKNNNELQKQTQELVHATRVVASATGRSIEDVTERIRSGLLGNTEAIEDLGIFVNVAMIESTNAFKKFANGKHWDQLDFRVQQQIRLAAILEQAYARYGNQVQQNVLQRQNALIEQWKDIKLHLSQAFLPIWDIVLPALTDLAKAIADVTERIARFIYWLRGWDYDKLTKGTNDQSQANNRLTDSYQDLEKQAKKTRGELAAFDELNLLGMDSGGGTGGGGIGGGPTLPPLPTGGGSGGGGGIQVPGIRFSPPEPPDAGLGAVAEAVSLSMNAIRNTLTGQWAQAWKDIQVLTIVYINPVVDSIRLAWNTVVLETGRMKDSVQAAFISFLQYLQTNASTTLARISEEWKATLGNLQVNLNAYRPYLEYGWQLIHRAIRATIQPLIDVSEAWRKKLGEMQVNLNAFRPYLEYGWSLLREAVRSIVPVLGGSKEAWNQVLDAMLRTAKNLLNPIIDTIESVINAWNRLKQTISNAITLPKINLPKIDLLPDFSKVTGNDLKKIFDYGVDKLKQEVQKPENQIALGILGALPAGRAIGAGFKAIEEALKNLARLVPAFASGGMVYGPTLAMVGDNPGASIDPEVIAPLSTLRDELGFDVDPIVTRLERIERAITNIKYVQAIISRSEVGQAVVDELNEAIRRGKVPFPTF